MKIYLGADHNGFGLKNNLISYLKLAGYEVEDLSGERLDPDDDFPVFASKVCMAVLGSEDKEAKGVLICGSGQGMAMAANRFKGIRASLCWDKSSAQASRNDSDSNVLCLPAKTLDAPGGDVLVETWLNTKFAGAPRFARRIKELDELGF